MEQLQRQIEELKNKLSEKDREFSDFKNQIEELKRVQESHTHAGNDGSDYLYSDSIILKPGAGIATGKFQMIDGETSTRYVGGLVIGDDARGSGTVDNIKNASTFNLEHQINTNSTVKNSFFYGIRSPFYTTIENVTITSGATTLSQNDFSWTVNELAGAYVGIFSSAGVHQFTRQIASNTEKVITIDGTFPATVNGAICEVFMPVYLGYSSIPWRSGYFLGDDVSAGGTGAQRKALRLGMGLSSGADVISLYFGTGSPEGVITANIGSLYLRTDGSTSTTLYVKTSGSSNTGWTAK